MSTPSETPSTSVARVLVPLLALATLLPFVTTGEGLVLGMALGLTLGNPYAAATKKVTTYLLQGAVVGLGFGMNLRVVVAVGVHGILYTAAGIALCFGAGHLLRALLKVPRDVGLLVTVGTAICGGSAIAAVVPAIGAKQEDASVSLAVVFLLNAVGLLLFPVLGHAVGLSEARFGLWAALAIHDTSSVVGAASAYGQEALEIATTVKLARALWIVPLAMLIGELHARAARARTESAGGEASAKRAGSARYPWFILGFLGTATLATFVHGMHDPGMVLARASRQLLVLTLFLIGAGLTRQALRQAGARPLVLGVLLWIVSAVASLAGILSGIVT
jgi:uncharacterized integral membrane protein (TIGR00698 family)